MVIAIIGILIALLLPAVQAAREAARRMQCSSSLRQVGLAMANYESQHRVLPPGEIVYPGANSSITIGLEHTALVQLLPFIEEANVSDTFNFSLRTLDLANGPAVRKQLSFYQCPSDQAAGREAFTGWGTYFARSNAAVCFGSKTMCINSMGSTDPMNIAISGGNTDNDGAFRFDVGRSFTDLADGTSTTAIISEVLSGSGDRSAGKTAWDARGLWAWPMMGSFAYTHLNTPNSAVGDTMYKTSADTECTSDPSAGLPCNPSAGAAYDTFQAAARSRHPGGVNVVFADGHTNFITDNIDLNIWQQLGSINDGLTLPNDF